MESDHFDGERWDGWQGNIESSTTKIAEKRVKVHSVAVTGRTYRNSRAEYSWRKLMCTCTRMTNDECHANKSQVLRMTDRRKRYPLPAVLLSVKGAVPLIDDVQVAVRKSAVGVSKMREWESLERGLRVTRALEQYKQGERR